MAINVSTNVADALSQRFDMKIRRQYNRLTVAAAEIKTEIGQGDAKNVAFDAVLGDGNPSTGVNGQQAGNYFEATPMANSEFTTDAIVPGILPWGFYRNGFSVSDHEFDTAFRSGGTAEAAAMGLLTERMLSAQTKIISLVNQDLWTGTGTGTGGAPNIIGFFGGLLAASGTYAGIPTSTYASWESNVLANGGVPRPLTFDLLAQLETLIYIASGQKPKKIIASPNVWRKYSALFEPLRRFNDETNVYSTSTDVLMWRGIPIIRDKDGYEYNGMGTLVMLNEEHLVKKYLPTTANSRADVWKVTDTDLAGFNGDGIKTPTGVPCRIIPLARTGDYMNFMVKTTVQACAYRRNALGALMDISII